MSGPIEGDIEAFIDGKVEFKELTAAERQRISEGLGELASADALGMAIIPVPELTHHTPKNAA